MIYKQDLKWLLQIKHTIFPMGSIQVKIYQNYNNSTFSKAKITLIEMSSILQFLQKVIKVTIILNNFSEKFKKIIDPIFWLPDKATVHPSMCAKLLRKMIKLIFLWV